MAKKKTPKISLQGLDDVNFDKKIDLEAAKAVVEPKKKVEAPKEDLIKAEEIKSTPSKSESKSITKPEPASTTKGAIQKKTAKVVKGTLPPNNKKRASFNIEEDLHKALKAYSYFNDIEMVEYIFEQLVKPDLKAKGYYPPKKRKK